MPEHDRLNQFLTQLSQFDPSTLDSFNFARTQTGDVFGDAFSRLFTPTDQGFSPLALAAGVPARGSFGLDVNEFFKALQNEDDLGFARQAFGESFARDQISPILQDALRQLGLGDVSSLRERLRDQFGLNVNPEVPFNPTNQITEQNPTGASPFARTTDAVDVTPNQIRGNAQLRRKAVRQGREALAKLQAVPASQLSDEERQARQDEIVRQSLERRRIAQAQPQITGASVPSRIQGVQPQLGRVV